MTTNDSASLLLGFLQLLYSESKVKKEERMRIENAEIYVKDNAQEILNLLARWALEGRTNIKIEHFMEELGLKEEKAALEIMKAFSFKYGIRYIEDFSVLSWS